MHKLMTVEMPDGSKCGVPVDADRAAQELKRLNEAFEAQRTAAIELARQRDYLVQAMLELKADIYRCERGGLEEDIDYALANLTHNAQVTGVPALSARPVD